MSQLRSPGNISRLSKVLQWPEQAGSFCWCRGKLFHICNHRHHWNIRVQIISKFTALYLGSTGAKVRKALSSSAVIPARSARDPCREKNIKNKVNHKLQKHERQYQCPQLFLQAQNLKKITLNGPQFWERNGPNTDPKQQKNRPISPFLMITFYSFKCILRLTNFYIKIQWWLKNLNHIRPDLSNQFI